MFGIYEPLTGWAVGLVLDLLIIVFTQSMLHALARGERSRAAQILSFIFVCTLISFLGNLAHNLHVPSGDAFTGVWFGVLLPSFGLACQHEARTDAPKKVFGEKRRWIPIT
ncbi:MAG: hypothetical protein J2P37_24290 [Ktedonobacteraceae bacterium]|nr:hypothetical protein [Ktedonobacteraceae bacterium]